MNDNKSEAPSHRTFSRWILPIVLYLAFSGILSEIHYSGSYKRLLRYGNVDSVKNSSLSDTLHPTGNTTAVEKTIIIATSEAAKRTLNTTNTTTTTVMVRSKHNPTKENSLMASSSSTVTPTVPTIIPTASNHSLIPHPHAGARDVNGTFGYIADVTMVRRWMLQRQQNTYNNNNNNTSTGGKNNNKQSFLPFQDEKELNAVCGDPPGQGSEGEAGYNLLMNHIVLATDSYNETNNAMSNSPTTTTRPKKILCVVYTYEGKHNFLQAITETWGWRCDGFFAASTKTVVSPSEIGFGAIDLPHLGTESYNTMWQKTRSIMGYLYDNYLQDYDYFLVGGDDMHIIVENMRAYLSEFEKEQVKNGSAGQGVLLGHHTRRRKRDPIYVGGGPGYVLNKAALQKFGEKGLLTCEADALVSAEDRYISLCMRSLGVELVDTADSEGRQRFQGLTADWIASENPWETKSWLLGLYSVWQDEGHGRRWGKNVTSPQSVSFHALKTPVLIRRHHAVLYKSCPPGTALGDAQATA